MEDFIIANCTDTGKVRTVNEDSMTTFDSPNGRVVVVCDGMGGQNAGDVASKLAVTVIQELLTDNKFNSPEEAITKSIIAANQAILMRAAQDLSLSGMGSTCVMLIISGGNVYYGSVGDSRIYYMAGGMLRLLTKDQSYVQTLVDAGELTQEAAEHHQDKNQITNALGIEGMTPPVVGQLTGAAVAGSVFLLCSDGLSGMVNNRMINQVISDSSLTLQDKAIRLVKMANDAGGVDNITVQLVEFPESAGGMRSPQPMTYGKTTSGKPKKNSAVRYWLVTIFCLIIAIGGGTYWMITKDSATSKQTTSTKTEQNEKTPKTSVPSTKTKSAETPAPKAEEKSKVKAIEEKTAKKEPNKNQPAKKIVKDKNDKDDIQNAIEKSENNDTKEKEVIIRYTTINEKDE